MDLMKKMDILKQTIQRKNQKNLEYRFKINKKSLNFKKMIFKITKKCKIIFSIKNNNKT